MSDRVQVKLRDGSVEWVSPREAYALAVRGLATEVHHRIPAFVSGVRGQLFDAFDINTLLSLRAEGHTVQIFDSVRDSSFRRAVGEQYLRNVEGIARAAGRRQAEGLGGALRAIGAGLASPLTGALEAVGALREDDPLEEFERRARLDAFVGERPILSTLGGLAPIVAGGGLARAAAGRLGAGLVGQGIAATATDTVLSQLNRVSNGQEVTPSSILLDAGLSGLFEIGGPLVAMRRAAARGRNPSTDLLAVAKSRSVAEDPLFDYFRELPPDRRPRFSSPEEVERFRAEVQDRLARTPRMSVASAEESAHLGAGLVAVVQDGQYHLGRMAEEVTRSADEVRAVVEGFDRRFTLDVVDGLKSGRVVIDDVTAGEAAALAARLEEWSREQVWHILEARKIAEGRGLANVVNAMDEAVEQLSELGAVAAGNALALRHLTDAGSAEVSRALGTILEVRENIVARSLQAAKALEGVEGGAAEAYWMAGLKSAARDLRAGAFAAARAPEPDPAIADELFVHQAQRFWADGPEELRSLAQKGIVGDLFAMTDAAKTYSTNIARLGGSRTALAGSITTGMRQSAEGLENDFARALARMDAAARTFAAAARRIGGRFPSLLGPDAADVVERFASRHFVASSLAEQLRNASTFRTAEASRGSVWAAAGISPVALMTFGVVSGMNPILALALGVPALKIFRPGAYAVAKETLAQFVRNIRQRRDFVSGKMAGVIKAGRFLPRPSLLAELGARGVALNVEPDGASKADREAAWREALRAVSAVKAEGEPAALLRLVGPVLETFARVPGGIDDEAVADAVRLTSDVWDAFSRAVPPPPAFDADGRPLPPSDSELDAFWAVWRAMDEPLSPFVDFVLGRVHPAAAAFARAAYPKLVAEILLAVLEDVGEQELAKAPYQVRVAFAELFGHAVDPHLEPDGILALQAAGAQTPEQSLAIRAGREARPGSIFAEARGGGRLGRTLASQEASPVGPGRR